MRYVILVGLVVFMVLCLSIGNYYYSGRDFQGALPNPQDVAETISWSMLAAQAALTIAGIAFGHLHRRLHTLRSRGIESVDFRSEFRLFLRSTNFLLALTAAPIVFTIVIAASKGSPAFTALIIAFQNGFFWQSVMPTKPEEQSINGGESADGPVNVSDGD